MKIFLRMVALCIGIGYGWYQYSFFAGSKEMPCNQQELGCRIVIHARKQIGVVSHYDNEYYQGGYPPKDRGACTDVIIRAIEDLDIPFKQQVDKDIKANLQDYGIQQADPNIDTRRVKTLMKYFDRHREKKSISTDTFDHRLPGDIVTYDQIPGRLRHIALISNKKTRSGRPYIIHNYGFGTVENDMLTQRPTKITGHWRFIQ